VQVVDDERMCVPVPAGRNEMRVIRRQVGMLVFNDLGIVRRPQARCDPRTNER
jgi:hypothetical protein